MVSLLKRLDHGQFELTISVPTAVTQTTIDQIIDDQVKSVELPGFRKGTAPRQMVEPTLDRPKILQKAIQQLVPDAYLQAITEQNLKPILNPKIELLSVKDGEDWQFKAISTEAPVVDLSGYQEKIKSEFSSRNLWIPGKSEGKSDLDRDEKIQKLMDILLKVIPVNLPEMLIEEETNHSLSRLVDQVQQLGVTVDQYLQSSNKTPDSLRQEYYDASIRNLQTEFILSAVALDQNITVTDKEIDDLIAATGDQDTSNRLNTPAGRLTVKSVLVRRRALDWLLTLIS